MAGLEDTFRIQLPFADRGDKVSVPQVDITNNFVNFDQGYTIDYEREIGQSADAKAVERRKQNWLFNLLTSNIKQWQEQGFPQWYKALQYSEGSCVRYVSYSDATGNVVGDDKMYRCKSDSTPIGMRPSGDVASGTWWEVIPSVGEILDSIPMPAGGGIPARELVTATTGIDFNNPATLGGTRTSGTWELASDAVAQGAANIPTRVAGTLEMKEWVFNGNRVTRIQRYTDRLGGCWFRSYDSANWTVWRTFVAAAPNLAGYGIADAFSSIQNRADNLVPDASLIDPRWVSQIDPGAVVAKVTAPNTIPAPYWWRFSGAAVGILPAATYLMMGAVINESFPVEPGAWYDISCWVQHGSGSTFGGGVHFDLYDNTGAYITTIALLSMVGASTPRDIPIKISDTVQIPANATACVAKHVRRGTDTTSSVSGNFFVGAAYVTQATRSRYSRVVTNVGLDFNNLTQNNVYTIDNDGWVQNAANRPAADAWAGTLYVSQGGLGIVTQVFVDRVGRMWSRGLFQNWSPWQRSITDTGDQYITGNLGLTGGATIGGGFIELGNTGGAPSNAYIDFHTDGMQTDANARIISPSGSSEIQLITVPTNGTTASKVRMYGGGGKNMTFLSDGTSADAEAAWRFHGAAGRANILDISFANRWAMYIQQATTVSNAELGVNGAINAVSDIYAGGLVKATGEVQAASGVMRVVAANGANAAMFRNDGSKIWVGIASTPYGDSNNLRPLVIDIPTGRVDMGAGLGVTGGIGVTGDMTATGAVNGATVNAGNTIYAKNAITTDGTLHSNSNLTVDSYIRAAGEIQTTAAQMRMVTGAQAVLFRNDGTTFYIMPTAPNDPWGIYGTLRPLSFNIANGRVGMNNGVTIGGGAAITGGTTTDTLNATTSVATGVLNIGTASYVNNGDVNGAIWGGWLSNWLNANTLNSSTVTAIRLGARIDYGISGGDVERNPNYVLTGGGDFGADDGYYSARPIQYFKNGQWLVALYS